MSWLFKPLGSSSSFMLRQRPWGNVSSAISSNWKADFFFFFFVKGGTEKEILGKHDILQLPTALTGERLQNNKMREHVHIQMPRRCSAKRGNDTDRANIQTHPIISLSDLSLHLSICLGRQSILGAVAHYPSWWLSPCQLTVQLAYKATANSYPSVWEKGTSILMVP